MLFFFSLARVARARVKTHSDRTGTLGFDIDDGPEGFELPRTVRVRQNVEDARTKGFTSSRIVYEIEFVRDPGFIVSTYVLVGWAFNMVGFLVFWLPVEGSGIDRSGVAITTILAAQFMMYDAKITKESTWLDLYFSIMLVFQFLAFVLMVHSSRMNRIIVTHGGDDDFFARVHAAQEKIRRRSRAHGVIFFLYNLLYGGLDCFWIDRMCRRVLVPVFFVVQCGINFFPAWGDGDITTSDHAGIHAPLFWINFVSIATYLLVLAGAARLKILYDETLTNLYEINTHSGALHEAETRLLGAISNYESSLMNDPYRVAFARWHAFAFSGAETKAVFDGRATRLPPPPVRGEVAHVEPPPAPNLFCWSAAPFSHKAKVSKPAAPVSPSRAFVEDAIGGRYSK